jgi:hypothetical protein
MPYSAAASAAAATTAAIITAAVKRFASEHGYLLIY